MLKFLPYALPDIGEDEINEVVDSLRSGWVTTGPKTKRFESDFSEFLNDNVESIAVNSATAGLHLALEAVGVGPGDEVITTAYTFTATAEVVRYLGAESIFVDIDPATFNMDPSKIEAAITPRTKAIIPVHFGGLACPMTEIIQIARRHNLRVIEDAAHSLPTTYQGKLIGTLDTDATVFSFYATKTITTGEGGMVVTRNPEISKRCRIMRLHGISRDAFERYTSQKPGWHYEVVAPGFKYNLTDIASSLGIHQLKRASVFQKRRNEMAIRYNAAFADLPVILPPKGPETELHAWHLYILRLKKEVDISREVFIEKMSEAGIGCSVHFIPLHLHPYWRDRYECRPDHFPKALEVYERAVSLPMYTKMTSEDQDRVIAEVRGILS